MKIRTQLIISMVFFVIALLIISASVIITNQQVEQLNSQKELVKNIEIKANELNYLSNDYLLYRESQQIDRWESKYSSLSSDVMNLSLNTPEQQVLVNNVKSNQQRLKEIFEEVVSSSTITSQSQLGTFDPEFVQVSSSRLGVQTQGIVFDASRLSQELHDEEDQLKQLNILLISVLLGTVVAFLLTSYFLIYRRTLTAMSNLQAGTRIIGSGNLDHTIEDEKDDEFGQLSNAFNLMTAQLKTITTSKTNLEKEIKERKKAEDKVKNLLEETQQLNEELEVSNEELQATTEELQVSNEKLTHARDNLEQKVEERTVQIEEALQLVKESELKAKERADLLDITHEAIFVHDMNNKISLWNDGAEEIYGWSKKEAVGNVVYDLLKTEFPQPLKQIKIDVLSKGRWEGELTHTTRDGTKVNVLSRWSLQKDKKHHPIGFLEVNVDITGRKKAEKALKLASIYNRSLIEASLDPLVTIGPDGKINDVNTATELVTGYPRDDLIDTDFSDYFTEPQKAKSGYQRVFREGEVRDYPLEIKHKNGDITSVNYNASVYKDDSGEVIGIFAAARDITEINKAYNNLKETIEELERSNKELQSFAYITSHDLQEPLRTMGSYAGLLKYRYGGQLDSDADDFLDYMVSGAVRLQDMIKGLLEYSRIGTRGGVFKDFNADEALDSALTNLESSIEECHVEVIYDPLPKIVADESQISRVFQNLIGNALKFRKDGLQPKIHIKSSKEGNEYIFSVQDNGIGIEPQYCDRIFEVFKRLHAIGEYDGTGIGLAIVKRIIERHHGRIWVESDFGVGSTFYFTIPVEPVKSGGDS